MLEGFFLINIHRVSTHEMAMNVLVGWLSLYLRELADPLKWFLKTHLDMVIVLLYVGFFLQEISASLIYDPPILSFDTLTPLN